MKPIIEELVKHVTSECTPADINKAFDEMLDDCYSFKGVGGPFDMLSPSEVLRECDPTAYRCGAVDYADSLGLFEIEGDSYDPDDVAEAKGNFLDRLTGELEDLTNELEEMQSGEDEPDAQVVQSDIDALNAKIAAKEQEIADVEAHDF